MADPFQDSRTKIDLAKTDIEDLNRGIVEFFKIPPYSTFAEVEPEGTQKAHKLKFTTPVPRILSARAWSITVSLRAALDSAWTTVATFAGIKPDYFPFAGSKAEFDNAINGRAKDFPQEFIALLRTFKPYKGGNNLLWAINAINNRGKHRLLAPIAGGAGLAVIKHLRQGTLRSAKGGRIDVGFNWDSEKEELVLYKVPVDAVGALDCNLEVALFVTFGDVESVANQDAVSVLRSMVAYVERMISDIEAECRRLGFI